jgi:hypothetical protein
MRPESVLQITVHGSSMRPILPPGSTVIVHQCKAEELRVGDIGLFRSGKALVVHRVVDLQGGHDDLMVSERGDWAAKARRRPAWQVAGRVVAVKLRHGLLNLERPLIKRINAFLGSGVLLNNTPSLVRRVTIPVVEFLLALVSAFNFNDTLDCSSKRNCQHESYPTQADFKSNP